MLNHMVAGNDNTSTLTSKITNRDLRSYPCDQMWEYDFRYKYEYCSQIQLIYSLVSKNIWFQLQRIHCVRDFSSNWEFSPSRNYFMIFCTPFSCVSFVDWLLKFIRFLDSRFILFLTNKSLPLPPTDLTFPFFRSQAWRNCFLFWLLLNSIGIKLSLFHGETFYQRENWALAAKVYRFIIWI